MSPTSQIGLDRLCWHNFENNRHAPKRIRNYARIVGENFRQKRLIGAVSESTSPKVKQLVNFACKWASERGGTRVFCIWVLETDG